MEEVRSSKSPVGSVPDPSAIQPAETPPIGSAGDGERPRRYEHYKGGRRATPDPLHQQVPRILQLLELFGVPVVSKPGLEADDIIATLTERILGDPAYANLHVRIVSRDKDLEQLLSERVTLFDIHTEAETDIAALRHKRGVAPEQVADLLVLAGDVVDNIPGVDGIGPKTAARLIQQFGSVDGIMENLDQIKGWWRENLAAARPLLPLSRQLVTLKRDSELLFSLEAARVRPLPSAEVARFFDELGFARLKDSLERLAGSSSEG
jgi:DNA polymerase-1